MEPCKNCGCDPEQEFDQQELDKRAFSLAFKKFMQHRYHVAYPPPDFSTCIEFWNLALKWERGRVK